MKKLLITGVSGLLGNNLAHYFRDKYEILGLYHFHPVVIKGIDAQKCDISKPGDLRETISNFRPSIVMHCASLTNIDQCEFDKRSAKLVNALSVTHLVDSLQDDTFLIYISTDAVYDGIKGNFSENRKIRPQNYYGITKYEGETEVLKHKNSLIVRTNIFGWNIQRKESLGEWVLDELKAGRKIHCFKDAYFSSLYTMELSRAIDIALQNNLNGIYNCGSSDACSKYDFALKIADYFGFNRKLIVPISIDGYNFSAKRGKKLSLNVNKFQKALAYKLPTIDQSVAAFYRDYKSGLPDQIKHDQSATHQVSSALSYGKHWICEKDVQSVVTVLRSERLTQGPVVQNFEEAVSDFCGARYGVAMNSATSALHAACLAVGITTGDEVITSPITFVASANCAVYCNAKPIFADIDPKTYNIDPGEIEKRITNRTKAVIPVHFAGQSCDMSSIQRIVRSAEKKHGHKIYIIEDACHALGSLYKSKKVGSCSYSDMTVLSFHPVKHITTGEGGMTLTNDASLRKKLKKFCSHGITSTVDEFINTELAFQPSTVGEQPLPNPWYYEQISLGYNYRLTDIQSALGLSQLKRLALFRSRRKEIVNKYNSAFKKQELITIPFEDAACDSNFHLYVLLFDFEKMHINRARFMTELRARDIQTQVHYIPVHLQPFHRKRFGSNKGDCPNAEYYYQRCLSIPLFPAMTDTDVLKVISAIKNYCSPFETIH